MEFLVDGTGLRGRCGIRAVRYGQDPAEMLVQAGEILRLLRSRRQTEEVALRRTFQFRSLFIQSRNGIRKSALPCFRSALLQLRPHCSNLRKPLEACVHTFDRAALHLKLLAKIRKRSFDARVHLHRERLRVALSIHGQLRRVVAGYHPRPQRIFRRVMHDRGDWKFVSERIRRRVMQVPHKTMHPCCPGKNLRRAHPIHRNGMLARCFFQRLGLVRAGVTAHEMILLVKDFKFDRAFCSVRQVVIDDRSVRRIFPGGKFRWKRRVGIAVPADANRFLRREEMNTFFRELGVHLPQRRDVIENPERAAVRGHN